MKLVIFNSEYRSSMLVNNTPFHFFFYKLMRIPGISFIHFLRDVYSMTTKTRLKHKTSHAPAGSKQYIQLLPLFVFYFFLLPNLPRWPAVDAILCREIEYEEYCTQRKTRFPQDFFVIYSKFIFWTQYTILLMFPEILKYV